MSRFFSLCVLVTLLYVGGVAGDNAFGYKSQAAWLAYYTQNNQLTVPDEKKDGVWGTQIQTIYEHVSNSHLRLDCSPSGTDLAKIPTNTDWPVKDFPMCDVLLKRVHSFTYAHYFCDYVTKCYGTLTAGVTTQNKHKYVDARTVWASQGTTEGTSKTSFGDARGLIYPDDMELPKDWGSLHDDTQCSIQPDSCRKTLTCQMSWVHASGLSPMPPLGTNFDGSPYYLVGTKVYAPPPQWGMSSRGDFGGFPDLPVEYCQICAHTACEQPLSGMATTNTEASAQPVRCQVGFAQAKTAKLWQKNSANNKICETPCPVGTWMTCTAQGECEYPPMLDGDASYLKWAQRVKAQNVMQRVSAGKTVQSNLITIPTTGYMNTPRIPKSGDLSQCFPCSWAGDTVHYGRSVGSLRDGYADFWCPGAASPPVDCTRGDNGVVHAGSDDMKTGCKCLAGYYSAAGHYTTEKISSELDCQLCPAGSFCRFNADTAVTAYNTSCPIYQQKCACPINYYCPSGATAPIKCDQTPCPGNSLVRTQCIVGFQTAPSYCVACSECAQMAGVGPTCLNMVNIANITAGV
jgi:hypothetical protein